MNDLSRENIENLSPEDLKKLKENIKKNIAYFSEKIELIIKKSPEGKLGDYKCKIGDSELLGDKILEGVNLEAVCIGDMLNLIGGEINNYKIFQMYLINLVEERIINSNNQKDIDEFIKDSRGKDLLIGRVQMKNTDNSYEKMLYISSELEKYRRIAEFDGKKMTKIKVTLLK